MARRKDHSPDELKHWVIESVTSFLQHQSASELSLRKVAKMVEYSPGTLINLFGSYAHLILEVNAFTLDQISERLEKRLNTAEELDAHQQLTEFAVEYLHFAQHHSHQWRLVFEHRLETEVPQWQQSRINQLFFLIETRLKLISPAAPERECQKAARTIWASVHGICMLEVDDKLFSPIEISGQEMITSLVDHYLTSWSHKNNKQFGIQGESL